MAKNSNPKKPAAPQTLKLERDGAVQWIRLNRPDAKNGITDEMRLELTDALGEADSDAGVRAIVITGEGRAFCVGADLASASAAAADSSSSATPQGSPEGSLVMDYRGSSDGYRRLFATYWELRTPVVSAVNGTVAGIGWMMALLADLVVAAEGARWIHVFAERGMAPHAGDPYFLRRILPFHALNEIAFLRERFTSEDLHRWGAVNRLVPEADLIGTAKELADQLAAGPTRSLGEAKRLYRRSLDSDMTTAFLEEDASLALLSQTHDRKEGVQSLMEGRQAKFEGR